MYIDPKLAEQIAAAASEAPTLGEQRPLTPGLVLHVDGDYLAYYASGNDETSQDTARWNAHNLIEAFRASTGSDKIVVHYTAPGCHKGERYLAATVKPYQGQRNSSRKPKNHGYLQRYIMGYTGSDFTVKTWAAREADDGIGACALYAVGRKPGHIAIATADKDMRMLPGLHVTWRDKLLIEVPPGAYEVIGKDGKTYGLKWFWLQMLMGDQADHIPGLEQYRIENADGTFKRFAACGEKTAAKMLDGYTTTDEAGERVWHEYKRGYHSNEWAADRFVEQAALLWMRTDAHATLTDFATHTGHSRINGFFCDEINAAVERLANRVKDARKQIDQPGG